MRDREGSRFSTCLQLHTRYLLLDLLGKGGFSEVFLVGAHHLELRWCLLTASPCRSWTKEACTKLHGCQLLLHLPGKAGLSEGQAMRGLQCLHAGGCTTMLSSLSCWRMLQGYQCPAVDSLFPTQMFFSCSLKGEPDPPGLCVAGSGP